MSEIQGLLEDFTLTPIEQKALLAAPGYNLAAPLTQRVVGKWIAALDDPYWVSRAEKCLVSLLKAHPSVFEEDTLMTLADLPRTAKAFDSDNPNRDESTFFGYSLKALRLFAKSELARRKPLSG